MLQGFFNAVCSNVFPLRVSIQKYISYLDSLCGNRKIVFPVFHILLEIFPHEVYVRTGVIGKWTMPDSRCYSPLIGKTGVGGITVQYLACLYSVAMVPTAIPHSLRLIQYYFGLWKPWETESQLAFATWAVPPPTNHFYFKSRDNHPQK